MFPVGLGILAMDDFLKVFKYHVVTMIFVVRGRSEGLATMREKECVIVEIVENLHTFLRLVDMYLCHCVECIQHV